MGFLGLLSLKQAAHCTGYGCLTVGPTSKIPPKIKPKKIVKMTGHTNAYNSLINFQYVTHTLTENGNYENFLKLP